MTRVFAVARIALGWVFFWAFIDKTFGLGFSTPSERAWIRGGNPTAGYLGSREGTFGGVFQAMADSAIVEWLFMLGLLGIGVAFLLGAGMRIGAWSGAVLMLLMWLAALPLTTNPFIDDHIVYAIVMIGLERAHAGRVWGIGTWWESQPIVEKNPWLA